jgi:hypothetical protein
MVAPRRSSSSARHARPLPGVSLAAREAPAYLAAGAYWSVPWSDIVSVSWLLATL